MGGMSDVPAQLLYQRSVVTTALLYVEGVLAELPGAEQLDDWLGNAAGAYAIRVEAVSGLLTTARAMLLDAGDGLDTAQQGCSV